MIRWFLLLLAAMPAFGADCALEYRFTAHLDARPRRFEVEMLWDAGDHATTQLRTTPEWGGVTDFDRAIRNVRTDDASLSIKPGDEPLVMWKVAHPRHARVSVKYDAVNDVANVDAASGIDHRDFYRNMVGERYFQLFGWAMLLRPEHFNDAVPIDACLSVAGLPENWTFATSLGEVAFDEGAGKAQRVYRIRTRVSPIGLRSALYLGGDFRIYRRDIEGRALVVALRGDWLFDDAAFVDATAALVRAQRAFWNDFDFPYYLISLLPNRFPDGSAGGTGLERAFAMHASRDFTVSGSLFERLIGHENLHSWLPKRIGSMGDHEALRYWFSEGFTDYLNHRLLVSSGMWSLEDYARALNRIVLQYRVSRARNAPNTQILEEFWKDPFVQRMPYLRGELLALRWDGLMAARGASLQQTLRRLRRADVVISSNEPADLAVNRLVAELRTQAGDEVDRDVASIVEAGETIPMNPRFLGPCFTGKHITRERPELGFGDGMRLAQLRVPRPPPRQYPYRPGPAQGIETFEFRVAAGALEDPHCRRWIEAW